MTADEFSLKVGSAEKKLYIAALSVTKNAEDAKDAVGNAVLKAWEKHDQLKSDDKFDAWLLSITYNEAKKLRSKARMFVQLDEIGDAIGPDATESDLVFFDTLARAGLDNRSRKIFTLYFFYGYNLEEISKMTGTPLSTVKSSYYRGLRKIADTEGVK